MRITAKVNDNGTSTDIAFTDCAPGRHTGYVRLFGVGGDWRVPIAAAGAEFTVTMPQVGARVIAVVDDDWENRLPVEGYEAANPPDSWSQPDAETARVLAPLSEFSAADEAKA